MGKTTYKKGQIIHHTSDPVGRLEIVLSGSVKLTAGTHTITAVTGGILGALETPDSLYSYTYEALEDTVLFDYNYVKSGDIEKVITSNPKIIYNLASAASRMYLELYGVYQKFTNDASGLYRFMRGTYDTYLDLCDRYRVSKQVLDYMDEITDFSPEDDIKSWKAQYIAAIRALTPDLKKALYASSPQLGLGIIMDCLSGMEHLVELIQQADDYLALLSSHIISGGSGDYFDLFSNLLFHVSKNPFADTSSIEAAVSKMIIYMTDSPYVDIHILHMRVNDYRRALKVIEENALKDDTIEIEKDAFEALSGSLDTIFNYAGIDPEERILFRDLIDKYKLINDKNSSDDDTRKLRFALAESFYDIYEKAFFKSVNDKHIPTVLKLFFCFGYMDEELCGINNAAHLFDLIKEMEPDPSGIVITIYDWLLKIYHGLEEPSKNEFDLDFPAYLREQKNNGSITSADEQRMLTDKKEKVHYEIMNFFSIGNRITFGRVTTFCPVLSEHNIVRAPKDILITAGRLHDIINQIKQIDYSAFYRTILYSNKSLGIPHEFFHKEIMPYIILLPNIGSKGIMWQETSDNKKDTPGRIMLSIFHTERIYDVMLRIVGELRWEVCKKVQGIYWNNPTDPSLTADYYDYFQYYKKNRNLMASAKEKIKTQLQRAKNNYCEAFIHDYIQWVKYESTGSSRLNKVARAIMFKYVPFSASLREQLASNPFYSDSISKHHIKAAQRRQQLNILIDRAKSSGANIPREFTEELTYIDQ